MVLLVEHLWIQSFPPLAFAVFLGQVTVVIHTGLLSFQVIALRRLIPRPGVIGMERDAQWQPYLLGGLSPFVKDISLRTYVLRVPWLVL